MDEEAIKNPSIFFGSFEWSEPMTTATDMVLALVCLYGFLRFYNHKGNKTEAFRFFLFYFLCFAIGIGSASIFGHALQAYLTPDWKAIGWSFAGVGIMFMELASLKLISNMIKRSYRYIFLSFIIIHTVCFLGLMLVPETRDFSFSAANSTLGLVFITMPMQIFHGIKKKAKGSWFVVAAIIFGFSPLFVYLLKLGFGRWFNYHDISHLLLAMSSYITFLGTWRLGTKPSSV